LTAPLAAAHANGSSATVVGQTVRIDTGVGLETATIAFIGTPGATGTGLTLTAPLALAHASGGQVYVPSMTIDTGANQQTVTLMGVGTGGASGTGVSFTPPTAGGATSS